VLRCSKKYQYPPKGRLTEIPREREREGGGLQKRKFSKESTAKPEFQEEWVQTKNLSVEGIWIFSGTTTHLGSHGFESYQGLRFFFASCSRHTEHFILV